MAEVAFDNELINEIVVNGGKDQLDQMAGDVANGNTIRYSGRMGVMVLETGNTEAITVTVDGITGSKGETFQTSITVPAGEKGWLGPFSNDFTQNDGLLHFAYTGTGVPGLVFVQMAQ